MSLVCNICCWINMDVFVVLAQRQQNELPLRASGAVFRLLSGNVIGKRRRFLPSELAIIRDLVITKIAKNSRWIAEDYDRLQSNIGNHCPDVRNAVRRLRKQQLRNALTMKQHEPLMKQPVSEEIQKSSSDTSLTTHVHPNIDTIDTRTLGPTQHISHSVYVRAGTVDQGVQTSPIPRRRRRIQAISNEVIEPNHPRQHSFYGRPVFTTKRFKSLFQNGFLL
jgi:hypothetical protein